MAFPEEYLDLSPELQDDASSVPTFAVGTDRSRTLSRSLSNLAGNDGKKSVAGRTLQRARSFVAAALDRQEVHAVVCVLILCSFVAACAETDAESQAASGGPAAPRWVIAASRVCLALLGVELALRLACTPSSFREVDLWHLVVFVATVLGLFSGIPGAARALGPFRAAPVLRLTQAVRSLRVVRCSRALRVAKVLCETMWRHLVVVLWTCAAFSVSLCFWSFLAVQLIHPLMDGVASQTAAWSGCERCARSFSSVMAANLTFVQTLVVADGWGLLAVPLLEAHPWTGLIFFGAFLSVILSALQLVAWVAADLPRSGWQCGPPQEDWPDYAEDERRRLAALFERLDADRSGTLSFAEVETGARKVREFSARLASLGIGGDSKHELRQFYRALDAEGRGEVESEKFVSNFCDIVHTSNCTLSIQAMKHTIRDLDRKHEHLLESMAATKSEAASVGELAKVSLDSIERIVRSMGSLERIFLPPGEQFLAGDGQQPPSPPPQQQRARGTSAEAAKESLDREAYSTVRATIRGALHSNLEEFIDRALADALGRQQQLGRGPATTASTSPRVGSSRRARPPRVNDVAIEVDVGARDCRHSPPHKLPDPGLSRGPWTRAQSVSSIGSTGATSDQSPPA